VNPFSGVASWTDLVPPWLPTVWADEQLHIPLLLLAVAGVLFFVWQPRAKTEKNTNATARAEYQQSIKLPRSGNRGFLDRHTTRWVEPIHIGGLTIETKDKHISIGATTGARKTTLIANLIMQAKRPCVVIAGDSSPYALEAMRARGWRVWSADGKNGGLYCFEGTPREAAQIITALFRMSANDTGLQRGMAAGVFRNAIAAMDAARIARSWPALRSALLIADPPDGLTNKNFDAAKVAWLARIDSLMDTLGPALGHDVSVLDCVQSECGLFFDLNAFSDMDMASRFGELAVRLTQHAADRTGDFWWIIDELGLFDADLLGQIVRTCRIRRVKFVGASQIISDFGKTLRGLVKCWFVGEQTAADHESRKWCSDLTMGNVPPENFAEHATPPGYYYVVADGHTQHLQIQRWHHPKPISTLRVYSTRPRPQDQDEAVLLMAGRLHDDGGMVDSGTEDDEEGVEQDGQPVWVTRDPDRQRFWSKMRRESCGCLRWLGGDNGQGRPKAHLTIVGGDGKKRKTSQTVYVVTYEWVHGEDSAEPTLDHRCHTYDETCPGNDVCEWQECENPMHPVGEPCQHGLCCEDTHLEPVSIQINQERNAAQKRRYLAWRTRMRAVQKVAVGVG